MLALLLACSWIPVSASDDARGVDGASVQTGREAGKGPEAPGRSEVPAESYADLRAALARDRTELAQLDRSVARVRARERLTDAVRDGLAPRWFGTPWAFYGTSTTPGEGTIACGYFVSTVLQHAGLRVERVKMAQQPSEYIVKTFADEPQIRRFRKGDRAAVKAWVQTQDDGLYVVGLDYHVGLLVKRGDTVELCHSGFTGDQVVVCSDPLVDDGFISRYHVVGPVLTDEVVDAWLDGAAIPTFTGGS
ncbi:MAG: hypothetical protein R3F61_16080 [Myxococcota bacterium]